ncbi:hypothetical protein Pelo_3947 [Pelomyxa schiedti]|nr:hypothetical protein Pelo_3947 [Pelomyxa schiedti]
MPSRNGIAPALPNRHRHDVLTNRTFTLAHGQSSIRRRILDTIDPTHMSTGRVLKWIAEFENNIRSRQLSDAEAVSEFRLAMDGPANSWMQGLPADLGCADMIYNFRETYVDDAKREKYKQKLSKRHQYSGEPASDYIRTMEMKWRWLKPDISEHSLTRRIKEGLSRALQAAVTRAGGASLVVDLAAKATNEEEAIRIAGEDTQQGNRANAFITQGELEEEEQDGEYEKRGKRAACWTPAQQEGRDKKPRTTGQERRESEIREKMEAIEGIVDRLAEQLDKQKAKAEEQRILLTNAQCFTTSNTPSLSQQMTTPPTSQVAQVQDPRSSMPQMAAPMPVLGGTSSPMLPLPTSYPVITNPGTQQHMHVQDRDSKGEGLGWANAGVATKQGMAGSHAQNHAPCASRGPPTPSTSALDGWQITQWRLKRHMIEP